MDPPKATFVSLAAMAERPQPITGTAAPWRAEVPRGGCRRLADWVLAHVRTPGGPTGPVQPVFRRPQSSPPLFLLKLNPIEPPWYGPVCPVVWEGRRREASPYPDLRRYLAARRR